MACCPRVAVFVGVLVLVSDFSAVHAMDFFSQFDGMFDDPFLLNFQNRSTCGRRSIASTMSRPTGSSSEGEGYEVVAGEYPWHVAIYQGKMKKCSAVLIHEQWLLTAASCVSYLKESYMVIAGATSLLIDVDDADDDDGSRHMQMRMTSEIYIHPEYDARRMEADIALVKVNIPFELNDHVNVICLPSPKMHRDFRPGSKAGIAGWGPLPPDTERPGMCPKPTDDILDECDVEVCETDVDCSEGEKCCRNGCDVMTCTQALPPRPGPRPGVLMGAMIPLINHTLCTQAMMGSLPKGVLCAGPTPMDHDDGGNGMAEEGGLLTLIKRKREMKNRGRVNDDNDDDGRQGPFHNIDWVEKMYDVMERVDGSDGGVDDYGRRRAGAWSIGMMGDVMRARMMRDGDNDDDGGMEDDVMMEGIDGEIDIDVERAMMDDGMEVEMEDRMKEPTMKKKEDMMMAMMKKNCKGDMGSPLVGELEGQWYLLGVTSLPCGCLFGSSPGLFTHVFNLRDWIRPIFNEKEPRRKSMMCTVGEYSCGDGWCIPEQYRCDGKRDCKLGTDEGQFCEGATKGFNVYLDHHLNRSSVAKAFPVTSFAQCAHACLTSPFMCPGFDAVLMPIQADFPPIVPKGSADGDDDDDDDDDGGTWRKDVTYDAEDESGDELPMMTGVKIMCLLANSSSTVVSNENDTAIVRRLKMAMMEDDPLVKPVPLHFKLPRHVPLAALFSPTTNLYLNSGLIVSPSYILGKDIAPVLEDNSFVIRFLKKLLMEDLVRGGSFLCFVGHPHRAVLKEMKETVKMMRKEAKMMMMRRMEYEERGGGEDGVMQGFLMNVRGMRMHLEEMARNFTLVMTGMKADCDTMDIKKGLVMKIQKMIGNASCEVQGEDRGRGPMEGEDKKVKPVVMVVSEMMNELQELMPDLLMKNIYPDGDGMEMMKMIAKAQIVDGDKMMMGRGSMIGDPWGMLGHDDVISAFLTDRMEVMKLDPEILVKNYNSSGLMMMMKKKMMMVTHALASGRCKEGNVTSGDLQESEELLMPAMDPEMGVDDVTSTDAPGAMKLDTLGKRPKLRHLKWSIAQSPLQVNTVSFRVLDARGPMPGDNNMGRDFGMISSRGLGGLGIEKDVIVSSMMRRMAMKSMGKDWSMDEDMEGMPDEMASPRPEIRRDATDSDLSTVDAEEAAIDEVLPGNIEDSIFWRIVEALVDMTSKLETGPDSNLIHLIEAMRMGEIDKEAFIVGVGPAVFRRVYARVMMKLKMLDAPGRVYPLAALHRGKTFSIPGSLTEVEQFATNETNHGIVMEYKSGWSCNKRIINTMGVLTSPNFPMAYPSNVRCDSLISAPPGYVVILFVVRFKLPWSPSCLQDSLTVFDEMSPQKWVKLGQGSFCGTRIPHVFRSTGLNLLVKFMSDVNPVEHSGMGFKIMYAFQPVTYQGGLIGSASGLDGAGAYPYGDDETKIDVMKTKLKGMKISLGVISGVFLLLLLVGFITINYHTKQSKTEKQKDSYDMYDTKL
ncbi:uncharacterized protein LOC121428837 [Lytechinus variegatus]|uniref:uncharacterized protein LOC121428837 n=1 Tax=Lytechinus variegatus TaxID=7654 RepID=UPI001BB2AC30|nr:uncharacterized protein LOC121428837 [Lytechinus variegatus]